MELPITFSINQNLKGTNNKYMAGVRAFLFPLPTLLSASTTKNLYLLLFSKFYKYESRQKIKS